MVFLLLISVEIVKGEDKAGVFSACIDLVESGGSGGVEECGFEICDGECEAAVE